MLVVDATVAASWLFDDETDATATATLAVLETKDALVPQLWYYEMRNILLVARRKQWIAAGGMQDRLAALGDLPL